MERKERLHLLLAHGFMSLFFGFAIVLLLAFVSFPFNPGGIFSVLITLSIFTLAFYCSGRIVSKYMNFTNADVHFLLNLALMVGSSLVLLDILSGGAEFTVILSNLSFLTMFLYCTKTFLKPKTEEVLVGVQPYMLMLETMRKVLQIGVAQLQAKWRVYRTRYIATRSKTTA